MVKQFNSIQECIMFQEERNRKDLGMSKKEYRLKCDVHDCKRKAEVYILTSIFKKISRFFKSEFNHDGSKYCKEHIKEMMKNLKLEKGDFKEI